MDTIFEKFIDIFKERISREGIEGQVFDNEFYFIKNSDNFKVALNNFEVSLLENENEVCRWHIDENSTKREIDEIVDDFCEVFSDKRKSTSSGVCPKKIKSEEVNINKMIDKIIQFFPDIRDKFENEIVNENIREKVLFVINEMVPRINDMICKKKNESKMERMFSSLSDSYAFGDENVRCVITIGIFNGIKGNQNREKVKSFLPFYIKKTWNVSWKVR